ncbi:MAG TPA: tetratricopeptide repeat protein [Blastocatellia bacterium]|nr:tetratricopeptide repeat protein [Blastocatellia bacterium]
MSFLKLGRLWAVFAILIFGMMMGAPTYAQTTESLDDQKAKAGDLIKQQRFTEALPMLEKLAAAEPDNSDTQFYLGFALLGQANTIKDKAERKALRVRSLAAFKKAKELGMNRPLLDGLIQSIPPDGSELAKFSKNEQAEELMRDAESFFSQGKLDEALGNYKKALELDPKIYEAALFAGDVYTQKGDFDQAEVWYQKAITIDPSRETAYRYSATPLMKQGKLDKARDRYVEAYVCDPYSKFSVSGLVQWAQATKTTLAHPQIDIPTDLTFDEKGDAKINIDAGSMLSGKDDGSVAWIAYGTTRSTWHKEKFAKTYPAEKEYRHSLAEEVDALRSVLSIATSDKNTTLNPSLTKLKKLNDEGLLEAYILIARPDQGIAQDYATYAKQNRDKLRRYVVEYVLTGGGK